MKTLKPVSVIATLLLVTSTGTLANDPLNISGVELHNNAHEQTGAQQLYEAWKLSSRSHQNDPFKRIAEGYSADFKQLLYSTQEEALKESYEVALIEMRDFSSTSLEERTSKVRQAVTEAYGESKTEDGIDYQRYQELLSSIREEDRADSAARSQGLSVMTANHSVYATSVVNNINEQNSLNNYHATINILSLMNDEKSMAKLQVINRFSDNIERAALVQSTTEETTRLVGEFSENCPACREYDVPVTPSNPPSVEAPPVETNPLPDFTSDNDCSTKNDGVGGIKFDDPRSYTYVCKD